MAKEHVTGFIMLRALVQQTVFLDNSAERSWKGLFSLQAYQSPIADLHTQGESR